MKPPQGVTAEGCSIWENTKVGSFVDRRLAHPVEHSIAQRVKLFLVQLEYWAAQGLSHLASAVGKPLYTDNMTASRSRISYARLCFEVDAAKELIKEFDLPLGPPTINYYPLTEKNQLWT